MTDSSTARHVTKQFENSSAFIIFLLRRPIVHSRFGKQMTFDIGPSDKLPRFIEQPIIFFLKPTYGSWPVLCWADKTLPDKANEKMSPQPPIHLSLSLSLSLSLPLSLSLGSWAKYFLLRSPDDQPSSQAKSWMTGKLPQNWANLKIDHSECVDSWLWSHEEENEDKNDVTADATSLKLIFLFHIDLVEPHRFDYITLVRLVIAEICFVIFKWWTTRLSQFIHDCWHLKGPSCCSSHQPAISPQFVAADIRTNKFAIISLLF